MATDGFSYSGDLAKAPNALVPLNAYPAAKIREMFGSHWVLEIPVPRFSRIEGRYIREDAADIRVVEVPGVRDWSAPEQTLRGDTDRYLRATIENDAYSSPTAVLDQAIQLQREIEAVNLTRTGVVGAVLKAFGKSARISPYRSLVEVLRNRSTESSPLADRLDLSFAITDGFSGTRHHPVAKVPLPDGIVVAEHPALGSKIWELAFRMERRGGNPVERLVVDRMIARTSMEAVLAATPDAPLVLYPTVLALNKETGRRVRLRGPDSPVSVSTLGGGLNADTGFLSPFDYQDEVHFTPGAAAARLVLHRMDLERTLDRYRTDGRVADRDGIILSLRRVKLELQRLEEEMRGEEAAARPQAEASRQTCDA